MKLFPKTILAIVPLFTLVLLVGNLMAFSIWTTPNAELRPNSIESAPHGSLLVDNDIAPKAGDSRKTIDETPQNPNVDGNQYLLFSALSIAFSSVFLTLILYVIINQYVVRPIIYLRNASEEVSKGNFEITLNTKKKDEISSLSRSFLEMCINLRASNGRVNKLAFYDDVTNLPNRRSYKKDITRITSEIEDGKKCAVILIDLDHFKEINDIYGHKMGDELLSSVSRHLVDKSAYISKNFSPDISTYVYRIAGDEFIVLLNNLSNVQDAVTIAESIQDSLSSPILVKGKTFTAKASMGVSVYPLHSVLPDSLFQYADMAMYEAKNAGRGKLCVFDENFLNKIVFESELESDIRQALREDQFHLVFQPKLSVERNLANEFEALIRWTHPSKGNVSPGVFIPFAEERNLINDIGLWVVEKLCQTIKSMEAQGWIDFRISFNTSPQQLQDVAFIRHLQSCIESYQINPNHLEMEITEHSIARDFDKTIQALEHVRSLGLTIAIDDFGTGYSSLSYLRRMPINIIKIDKVFISEALQNLKSRTVVETILTLANGLGMKTVAEGVETLEEFNFVKSKGCDYVQGFFYSKPISTEEMAKYKEDSIISSSSVNHKLLTSSV